MGTSHCQDILIFSILFFFFFFLREGDRGGGGGRGWGEGGIGIMRYQMHSIDTIFLYEE